MIYTKIPKHIEIVRSTVSSVNSMGKKSSNALYQLLSAHYTTVGVSIVNSLKDLEAAVAKQPDLVFMGMKYVPGTTGSKVWVSTYLDQHGINHTGSPRAAIELEQDKSRAKRRVLDNGLTSSPYVIVKKGTAVDIAKTGLRFPLFVKPTDLGAGAGVDEHSVVHNQAELQAKVASLAQAYGSDALVENYLSGREFSVAVLKKLYSDELVAMPLELLPGADEHGDRILSHKLKSAPLETPVSPVTDPVLRNKLAELATKAFTALGARDYGRIDIRLDAAGTPHFLEANLIPCIIEGSGNFPKACAMNQNMDYEAMILHIVNLAFSRSPMFVRLEEETDSVILRDPIAAFSTP